MHTYVKDPNSVLDYKVDWAAPPPVGPWLADGDTITTSTWIVPDGITKDSATNTATTTTIWLSGGTLRAKYAVTNRVTTAGGRTEDRTFWIVVRER
jgi:hypothetical protein